MRSRAETAVRIITVVIGCMLAILIVMWAGGDIGVLKGQIEQDARSSGSIPPAWAVQRGESRRMQALVFYDPDDPDSDARAMVYVNRSGVYGGALDMKFAFGWFYRGGTPNAAPGTVEGLTVEGYDEVVYLSGTGVARIVTADGAEAAHDPAVPLAWVGGENVRFFAADGTELPSSLRAF